MYRIFKNPGLSGIKIWQSFIRVSNNSNLLTLGLCIIEMKSIWQHLYNDYHPPYPSVSYYYSTAYNIRLQVWLHRAIVCNFSLSRHKLNTPGLERILICAKNITKAWKRIWRRRQNDIKWAMNVSFNLLSKPMQTFWKWCVSTTAGNIKIISDIYF